MFLWKYYAFAVVGTSRYLLRQKRSISTITPNKDRGWKICQVGKRDARPCNLKLRDVRAVVNNNIVPVVKEEGSSSVKSTIVIARQRSVEELLQIRRTGEGEDLNNQW